MNSSDTLTTRTVTIPPEVMARKVGDETVILDLTSGKYFGLDPVGTRIWQLVAGGMRLPDVSDAIVAEYDVARPEAERDLALLLSQLEAQGLIRRS